MITKVRLKNWKSHLNSEFEFSGGVNALVGIMGSGKSSVLDAISFALFGTFPNLNSKKITLDDLIMKRPQESEEAEVGLEFVVDGKTYNVRRKVKKDKGTVEAEIREGDKLIEVNPSSVTSHIERILQIDYTLFSKAVYSEQNNIDYFLTIPKGKRMQHIDKMLRLDLFEAVREGSVSVKNNLEISRLEKMKMITEMEKENIGSKTEDLRKGIAANKEILEKIRAELDKVSGKKDDITKEIQKAQSVIDEFIKVEKDLERLKASISEIERNLEGLKEKTKTLNKESLLTEIKSIEFIANKTKAEIKTERDFLDKKRGEIAGYNTEIRLVENSVKDLERLGDKCPVCESGITKEKRCDLEIVRKNRVEDLRKGVNLLAAEIENKKAGLNEMEEKLSGHEKDILRSKNLLEEFGSIESLVQRLQSYKKQNLDFENRKIYLELETKNHNIERLRLDLQNIVSEATKHQVDFFHLNRMVQKDVSLLADLEKRLELFTCYKTEVELANKNIDELGKFTQAVKITQDQLRGEFTKTVNQTMSRIWSSLYPYRDFEDIRLVVDGDYILQLKTGDEWVPVDGVASGGERTIACLALRVAFSLAFIPNLKWLILDEPTHNLDAAAIKNFSDVLSNRIGSFVKQIFLITHEPRIAEDIDGFVYKLERDKAINGVTQVISI